MEKNQAEAIVRDVLIQKFLETQDNFYGVIHELLHFSKDWVEQAIGFKLPAEIKRTNIRKWNHRKNHDWDSAISSNWNLDEKTIQCLLEIQPLDFWVLYLKMRSYETSLNNLDTFKSFSPFLNSFSGKPFPLDQWNHLQDYSKEIFALVKEEDVIHQLREKKLQLFLIEKAGDGKIQVNMMNIVLYSMLFNLNHIEITILCIFISHLLIFVEVGLDTDEEASNRSTIDNWNTNGNWGKVVNYYLSLATHKYEPSMRNVDLKKCLDFLIEEDGIRLYPFEFQVEKFDELIPFKNEKMRTMINELRKKENSNELIQQP